MHRRTTKKQQTTYKTKRNLLHLRFHITQILNKNDKYLYSTYGNTIVRRTLIYKIHTQQKVQQIIYIKKKEHTINETSTVASYIHINNNNN